MIDVVIKLKPNCTMQDVATEVEQLNAFSGTPEFPRPIPCNVEAGTVGEANTPVDEYGYCNVRLDYEFLDLSFLPATPQTFSFVFGKPESTGAFA